MVHSQMVHASQESIGKSNDVYSNNEVWPNYEMVLQVEVYPDFLFKTCTRKHVVSRECAQNFFTADYWIRGYSVYAATVIINH